MAEKAIQVFPNVTKYFDSVKEDLPNSMIGNNLEEVFSDKLILAKLAFFSSIANIVQPFLKQFQFQKLDDFIFVQFPFLLHRQIMSKFLRHKAKDSKTLMKFFEVDLTLSKNHH